VSHHSIAPALHFSVFHLKTGLPHCRDTKAREWSKGGKSGILRGELALLRPQGREEAMNLSKNRVKMFLILIKNCFLRHGDALMVRG